MYPFGHIHNDTFPYRDTGHPAQGKDVVIGNDAWIASGATLMPGVVIGDGAVVAANSHVVKSVAPYTIVGGNPARPIRKRFKEDQVEALTRIKWWDWPEEKIQAEIPQLNSDDSDAVDRFIAKHVGTKQCLRRTNEKCTLYV
jgi:tetrahydrodipicolinate N-succinyltransferase